MIYKQDKSILEKMFEIKQNTIIKAFNDIHKQLLEQQWKAKEREQLKKEIISEVLNMIKIKITDEATSTIKKIQSQLNNMLSK